MITKIIAIILKYCNNVILEMLLTYIILLMFYKFVVYYICLYNIY